MVPATPSRVGARRLAWITPRLVSLGVVLFWVVLAGAYFGGHDTLTYLAAGERLNAGHPLYQLSPGDRIVETAPPYYGPLLSPPLIAVLFRPIALIGLPAMWAWTVILGLVVASTVASLARTWSACVVVFALGAGIGMATISGNISSLFIAGYVALWRWRDRPILGVLVGLMLATKLVPVVFVGFLVAGRRPKSIAWCICGAATGLAITLIGAGLDNTLAYIGVALGAAPQPTSLPYVLGLPWLSPILLLAGSLAAMRLKERPAFLICVLAVVFGAPVLTWREVAALVVLIAPFTWQPTSHREQLRGSWREWLSRLTGRAEPRA